MKSDILQPPQSLDAEQAVLGSIMKDDMAINEVVDVLAGPEDFYAPKHGPIYAAILELYAKSEPCDITTIANILVGNGQLDKIGGRSYLVDLCEGVASTANVRSYAQIVLEKALSRRLIETCNKVVRSAYAQDTPVEELLDVAEQHVFAIAERKEQRGAESFRDSAPEALTQIDAILNGQPIGTPTGFVEIDRLIHGLRKGELTILAARPSMGKSALAMNIADNVASTGAHVGMFSLEMSIESLTLRVLCSRARISSHRLQGRKLNDGEYRSLTIAGNAISQLPILVDDSGTLSTLQIHAKARRMKAKNPDLALIIVDYLQMMSATGRFESKQVETAAISRSLKVLARELDISVIGVSQLSRGVEMRGGDKRPQLSDLRDSGAIEQDADVVMFVYRPEYYLSPDERADPKNSHLLGVAEVIVAKQRNGPTGIAKLSWLSDYATFTNMEWAHSDAPF